MGGSPVPLPKPLRPKKPKGPSPEEIARQQKAAAEAARKKAEAEAAAKAEAARIAAEKKAAADRIAAEKKNAEEATEASRVRRRFGGGRATATVRTSVRGVTEEELKLGKKSLLGR